jgi:hypothetical protein
VRGLERTDFLPESTVELLITDQELLYIPRDTPSISVVAPELSLCWRQRRTIEGSTVIPATIPQYRVRSALSRGSSLFRLQRARSIGPRYLSST